MNYVDSMTPEERKAQNELQRTAVTTTTADLPQTKGCTCKGNPPTASGAPGDARCGVCGLIRKDRVINFPTSVGEFSKRLNDKTPQSEVSASRMDTPSGVPTNHSMEEEWNRRFDRAFPVDTIARRAEIKSFISLEVAKAEKDERKRVRGLVEKIISEHNARVLNEFQLQGKPDIPMIAYDERICLIPAMEIATKDTLQNGLALLDEGEGEKV